MKRTIFILCFTFFSIFCVLSCISCLPTSKKEEAEHVGACLKEGGASGAMDSSTPFRGEGQTSNGGEAAAFSPTESADIHFPIYHNLPSVEGGFMAIRPSVLAGQWYPREAQKLQDSIEKYLFDVPSERFSELSSEDVRALIVPHAGHMWSGPTAASGYRLVQGRDIARIFILCPNHRVPVSGIVAPSADAFETPLGNVPVDRDVVQRLRDAGVVRFDDGAHKYEHAIEIQLPFIQVAFSAKVPKIVPLIVGILTEEEERRFADMYLSLSDARTLLIVSSDFLHYGENYGYVPFGALVQSQIERYDKRTLRALSSMDGAAFDAFADENPHAACGLNAMRLAEHIFSRMPTVLQLLAYGTSGHLSGDESMSVSYAAVAFLASGDKKAAGETALEEKGFHGTPLGKGEEMDKTQATANVGEGEVKISQTARQSAHAIVRRALMEAVQNQAATPYSGDFDFGADAPLFSEKLGVFVTLHDASGDLRGCIGNILPVASLSESLWERAQDAALQDPRFHPVQRDELETLSVEISILTRPVSIDTPDQIVLGKHGILLKKGYRSAVFLPQVATEQGWDLETTLAHLSLKAGMSPHAWRDGASFQVFEAEVF